MNAPLLHVNEDVMLRPFDESKYLDGLSGSNTPLTKITSLTDAAIYVLEEVCERLKSSETFQQSSNNDFLFRVIAAAIADWTLFKKLGVDTAPTITRFIVENKEGFSKQLPGENTLTTLHAHMRSAATRDFLILALETLTTNSVHDVLKSCDLEVPNRQPEPTPIIVRHFQPKSRPIQYWTDNMIGGKVAFIVYFSPPCTFRQCLGCALPDLSSESVIRPYDLIEQTDYVFHRAISEEELSDIRTLVISNNGSVLDEPTFPQSVLLHAVQVALAKMPRLHTVSLETRAEFISPTKLEAVANAIRLSGREDVSFEISLGVEIFDEKLRNRIMKKGLSNRAMVTAVEQIGTARGKLRCYFMYKGVPGMSDLEAFADLKQAIGFFDELSVEFNTPVLLHVNPTYAAVGTDLELALKSGRFTPPDLNLLVGSLKQLSTGRVKLHFGLNDEGLAVEGGSFQNAANESAIAELQYYNRFGEFAVEG